MRDFARQDRECDVSRAVPRTVPWYAGFISLQVGFFLEALMKKGFGSFLILAVLFFSSPDAAMAEGYDYVEKAGEKFGNGFANAGTGFLEIPKTIFVLSQSNGPVFGATIGLLAGVLHAIGRTLYGTIDMATFMIPTKALIDPDYVWHEADKMTTFQAKVQMR